MSGGLRVERGIVRVAHRAAAIERRRLGLVERRVTLQALDQVRVGDEGLAEGDDVVAKAGTFLRNGDAVRPVRTNAATSGKLSEATR